MRIGVNATVAEVPPTTGSQYNTANAFMIGYGDSGPVGTAVKCGSISDVTNTIGPRSATNSVLWDSADVFFRESGTSNASIYLSRIAGTSTSAASLTLQDSGAHACVVFTAAYPGNYGNTLQLAVTVVSGNYTITVEDANGNTLETHGPYATASGNTPLIASASSYGAFTQPSATGNTTNAPVALAASFLTGGTDNRSGVNLASLQTALGAFKQSFGPGQVSAPGYTNTTMSGIWTALGAHASANNRVAVCDMDDQQTATTLISALGSFGSTGTASYCGFWAGQVVVPSSAATPGVTRTVPASSVISALCARVDNAGNPNQPAAGTPNGYDLALKYASGFTGVGNAPLYGQSDIDTLSVAGINTWNNMFGVLQNYGFESPVPQASDSIAWQFNHARMRMALEALTQVVGQPFVFSQISQIDISAFSSNLAASMNPFVTNGAISTIAPDGTADQGFVIDTSSDVNTPQTMAAGQLNASVYYRPAPYAQLINVQLNAVPVTSSLAAIPVSAATA